MSPHPPTSRVNRHYPQHHACQRLYGLRLRTPTLTLMPTSTTTTAATTNGDNDNERAGIQRYACIFAFKVRPQFLLFSVYLLTNTYYRLTACEAKFGCNEGRHCLQLQLPAPTKTTTTMATAAAGYSCSCHHHHQRRQR